MAKNDGSPITPPFDKDNPPPPKSPDPMTGTQQEGNDPTTPEDNPKDGTPRQDKFVPGA